MQKKNISMFSQTSLIDVAEQSSGAPHIYHVLLPDGFNVQLKDFLCPLFVVNWRLEILIADWSSSMVWNNCQPDNLLLIDVRLQCDCSLILFRVLGK